MDCFLKLSNDHSFLKLSCKTVGHDRNLDELIGSISTYNLLESESLRARNVVVASLSSETGGGEKEQASAAVSGTTFIC